MPDYETKEGCVITVLGKHNDAQGALDKLNGLLADGWFETSFSEESKVILIEGSFLSQRKEYPLKITGRNKERIVTLL